MNKIFKVVWSKAKQCYVVVSEVAKNHSGKKKIVVASVLAALAVGSEMAVVHVQAAPNAPGTAVEGSVAWGVDSKATGLNTVGIGKGALATGKTAVAVGNSSTASNEETVALGNNTTASGIRAVSVGLNTTASGTDSIAMGYLSTASGLGSTAIGRNVNVSNEKSTAMGYDLTSTDTANTNIGYKSSVAANQAVSVGARNSVESSAQYSTALGYFVRAVGKNAVGIGSSGDGSTVNAIGNNSIAIGKSPNATGIGATAIGSESSATANDSLAIGSSAQASGDSAAAYGRGAVSSADSSTAIGRGAGASADNSTAVGRGASASAENSTAIGRGATVAGAGSVALGWNTEVTAADVATGSSANVKPYLLDASTVDTVNDAGNGIVAIGTRRDGSTGFARRLTGVAGGVNEYDAVNLKQLKALEAKSVQKFLSINGAANRTKANYPDKTWTIGSPATTAADGSTTAATTSNITIMGNYDNEGARGDNSVALGPWANGIGPRSVALGSNSVANGNQAIALGQSTFGHGENTLAVGSYATVNGENSIAIGTDTYVGKAERNGTGKAISSTGDKTTFAVAIGFSAKAYGGASTVIGKSAQSDIAHSVVLGEGSKAVEADATNGTSYLTGDTVNNSGNGVVSVGNTSAGSNITRRIINVAGGSNDLDAVNVKQLKAIESTSLKTLTINNGGIKTDLTPQDRKLTLTAGNNVTLTPNAATGEVTISATGAIHAINSGNANTLSVNNNNGTVTITPNTASNLSNTADANKLVTAGTVKSALDQKANASDLAAKANASDVTALRSKVTTVEGVANTAKSTADTAKTTAEAAKTAAAEAKSGLTAKIDTTAERHVKEGSYAVQTDGTVTLTKVDGAGTEKPTEAVKITGLATKASVDTLTTKVGTVEATANAAKVGLADKADKSTVSDLTTKVGTVEATANAAKAGLADKADKSTVSDLTTKVGTVEATANAAKTGLADKADKSTVSDLTTKVGTVEATANAAKAGLEGKLDKASELHVKQGTYTVAADGSVTLTKVDGEGIEKADEAVVINGFATKASVDILTTEVGKKANADDVTAELAKKANADDVTAELAKKANADDVTAELAKKANADDVTAELAKKANADDVTAELAKKANASDVTAELAKKADQTAVDAVKASLGDLSSNGRDGANGTSANKGLTAQDGLNGKTLADKVNALRNGEAGTLVYTDKDGHRLVKAKDGNYYRVEAVLSDGTVKPELELPEGIKPEKIEKPELRIVSPDGTTTPAKLSNVDNGTIAENSKDAVNGGQLFAANKKVADIIGTTVDANGQLVAPTFNVKDKDNNNTTTVAQAINLMNDKLGETKNLTDLSDAGKKVITDLVNVTGDNNIIVKPSVDEKTKVKTFTAKLNDTITLGAGDNAITVNGTNGTITAGNGDNAVTINGTNGIVTAKNVKVNDGVFGAPADAKGIPTAAGNTTTINNYGLSVVSKDAAGNVSTIEIKDGKISGLTPGKGDNDAATVGQVNDAIAQSAGNIGRALEKTSQRVNQVGAHAAALAAMNPLSYDPLRKSQIMAGIGTYSGNQALALGVAHYANENFMFNVGVTMGEGKSMANVGATYRFGTGDDDKIPERYKGGPISSVYVMQDEISALKAENARKDVEYGNKIDMLMERIAMLEAKLK